MHIKLVQLRGADGQRRVAVVDEPELRLLRKVHDSVFRFASRAIEGGEPVAELIELSLTGEKYFYDDIYYGRSEWVLLPCYDHPDSPMQCIVSGTGLTHRASAQHRQQMHQVTGEELRTDSIILYEQGVLGGKPSHGGPGVQPEWFYKGNGTVLRAHGETLEVPVYGEDGGEEAEIAGLYLVNAEGLPVRIGFCQGNEFSDHKMENKNYLYLAPSKLRSCAIGPELVLDPSFADFSGKAAIVRGRDLVWESALQSGEEHMVHSLDNIEFHHFKHVQHCLPGQAHIHFFGTGAFSYGEGISLEEGDVMRVAFNGLGRPLENRIHFDDSQMEFPAVRPLL